MRLVVIAILALCCGGCAAPAFDLVSRDPESPWLTGQRWVRTESSVATVSVAFDRHWLDHMVFDVEVVNQSDAPLVVDPSQFSFTLASSGDDLPPSARYRFAAEDPDRMHSRIERATPSGNNPFDAVMFVGCVAVVALAVLAGTLDASPNQDSAGYEDAGFVAGGDHGSMPASHPARSDLLPTADDPAMASDFDRERERSMRDLLPRTELGPRKSVRGEVWLPARVLRKVLDGGSSGHGITAGPPRRHTDLALTLRTPDALGGQEIDYSIAADH